MKGHLFCVLLLVCLLATQLRAQERGGIPPLKIGLGMMGFAYVGDMTDDENRFHRVYPGGSFSLQFEGKSFIQPQLNAGLGKFVAESERVYTGLSDGILPNDFVETSFFFFDLRVRLRFLRKKRVQPYVSVGGGILLFNPKDKEGNFLGENIFTRLEEEELYNTTVPYLPLSLGVQFKLVKAVDIGLEYTYRLIPSDYLDNIGQLGAREGSDRLHSLQVSMFFTLGLGKEPSISNSVSSVEPVEPELPPEPPIKIDPSKEASYWRDAERKAIVKEDFLYYRLGKGEDIEALSRLFHISLENLRTLNGLKPQDKLVKGNSLKIPNIVIPTAQRAWVFDQVAETDNPSVSDLGASDVPNEEINWVKRERRALETKPYVYYKVKKGERAKDIALKCKVRLYTLYQLNRLDSNKLIEGHVLRLPDMR